MDDSSSSHSLPRRKGESGTFLEHENSVVFIPPLSFGIGN